MLASLVLTLHDDGRRQVRDPHCRVGAIDVLATGPSSAVGVDAKILLVDLHHYLVAHIGNHGKRSKARVPALLRVEGRDPDQPVDADLAAQMTVGVVALDGEGDPFDAGLLAGLHVEQLGLVVALLAPAQVHAEQHLGPVAGLGAAGARVDRHDRAARVVLARQQAAQLRLVESRAQLADLGLCFGGGLGVARLVGQLEQHVGVGQQRVGLVEERDLALGAALVAQQLLGALAVVPELGGLRLLLELG